MKHLSHTTLVLLLDAELSQSQVQAAESHLAVCAACRVRRDEFCAVMKRMEVSDSPAADAAAHHALALRLAAAGAAPAVGWWRPRLLVQAGALALLLVLGLSLRRVYRPLQDAMAAYEATGPKPNHALTPGSVRSADLGQLCSMPDNDLDPTVAPEKARAVLRSYGLDETQSRAYQVDYLINPQLGGNDAVENLWPEPYHATVWNAAAKDALEARLHGMVCSGQLPLDQAQHQLANDWIQAYKQVFHATRPVQVRAYAERPGT